MTNISEHLILYDGTCGLCHFAVQWILKRDKKNCFYFAPLQGDTAKKWLKDKRLDLETVILIENFRTLQKVRFFESGQGALRICWLIGGLWKSLGIFSFLPPFFTGWAYRIIAKNRFQWFSKTSCLVPKDADKERFLP